MPGTAASYRNPQPELTQEIRAEQTESRPRTLAQLCGDLEALCVEGFLKAEVDDDRVLRYRPVRAA
jgi:hypothetical protein